jgi:glycosyltransferase involved in cell wall biosynthesis
VLIILPGHLQVSGVTTWAMRAIAGLRSRDIPAGLVVHTKPGESVPRFLEPYVVGVVRDATPIESLEGGLDEMIPIYLDAIRSLFEQTREPIVVAPNLHGDCYGAVAAIAQSHPHLLRVVSWIHSDNGYDLAIARHYEKIIHAFVPVSAELAELTNATLPLRKPDVIHIPHGIQVHPDCPERSPATNRPLRILYTGRIEEHQKRISTLSILSRTLSERAIEHELRIVGDGPEMGSLQEAARSIKPITIVGAIEPVAVNEHLRWADVWVLASRFEGQSVAMLEAMAQGCVPIVTRVRSGANDAVIHGDTGLSVEVQWDTPIERIASKMVDAIEEYCAMNPEAFARRAHRFVFEHHSAALHTDALIRLVKRVRSLEARTWPADERPAYSAPPGQAGGSTPADARDRMKSCLDALAGHRVLIYGTGQHTKDLIEIIKDSPAIIAGFIDDDPQRAGETLAGFPISIPEQIKDLDASDLVISSWIHEEQIWAKRLVLESLGVRLHRLYHNEAVAVDA